MLSKSHAHHSDKYSEAFELNYFDEPVSKIAAGKFHSLFLTESGKLFSVGYNKYGQLGISNTQYAHAEYPVEVYLDGVEPDANDSYTFNI